MLIIVFLIGVFLHLNYNPILLDSGLFGKVYLTEFNAEEFSHFKDYGYRDALIKNDSSTIITTHLEGFHGSISKIDFLSIIGFKSSCKNEKEKAPTGFFYSISKMDSFDIIMKSIVFDLNNETNSQQIHDFKKFWHDLRANKIERYIVIVNINIVWKDQLVFSISIQENRQTFKIHNKLRNSIRLRNSLIIQESN